MKGIDKEQWRSTVALRNDVMKIIFFIQFGIITIGDGKIHFYWFDFLSPTIGKIWEFSDVKRTHHRRWWDFFTTFSNSSGLLSKMVLLLTKRNTLSHQIFIRVLLFDFLLLFNKLLLMIFNKTSVKFPATASYKTLWPRVFDTNSNFKRLIFSACRLIEN